MSVDSFPRSESLPAESAHHIDRICDQFEATWKEGSRPHVEDFIDDSPEPIRSILWRELVTLELEYRRRNNDEPTLAEYESRFPDRRPLLHRLFGDLTPANSSRQRTRWSEDASATDSDAEATSASGELTVGSVLGEYELLERIGTGGMGLVYRARQRKANRIVAVKVIRPRVAEEFTPKRYREWLERFQREAQLTAGLEHDDIVPIYEVGETAGQPFYAMRYIDGRSLAEIIRDGPVADRHAAAYVERVARAVHFAHQRGVLHRDIKPGNILVDRNDRPYVSDFGLARWIEGASSLTETGVCLGSPPYMSPEQVQDAATVTAASDVYSLGATLYDVLTGRPPFRAARVAETLNQIIHREPAPLRQLSPSIDRDLETITLKCLSKEPNRRYGSALALAEDLRRYLDGKPIEARCPHLAEKAWRWTRRNPVIASLTAAVVTLVCVTLALTSLGYWQVTQAWKETEIQRDDARMATRQSLLEQARALRVSTHAGRRWAALAALRRAAAIFPGEDLRNEYIRCLDLPDVRLLGGKPPDRGINQDTAMFRIGTGRMISTESAFFTRDCEAVGHSMRVPAEFEFIEESPDRRHAVARHRESRRFWLIGLGPDEFKLELHDAAGNPIRPHLIAFSDDSRLLAVASDPTSATDRGQTVLLYRTEKTDPKPIGVWEIGEPGVDCLRFSPSGEVLVATTNLPQKQEREFGVRRWDVKKHEELSPLVMEPSTGWRSDLHAPARISFSEDGRLLAVVRNRVAVWSLEPSFARQRWSHSLEPHPADIVQFLKDPCRLVTVDRIGQLKLWDVFGNGELAVVDKPVTDFSLEMPVLPNDPSASIVCGAWNTGPLAQMRVWECAKPISRTYGIDNSVDANAARPDHFALAFSPDERWLAYGCGSSDRNAPYLIDLQNIGTSTTPLKEDNALPRMLTFSANSHRLWSAARREQTTWQIPELKPSKLPSAGLVLASAFHGDERVVARFQQMTRVTVVELSNGATLWSTAALHSKNDQVSRPQFSPDGLELLTGIRDVMKKDSARCQVRNTRDGMIRNESAGGSGHFFFQHNRPVSVVDVNHLALKDLGNGKLIPVNPPEAPSPAANYDHFDKLTFSDDGTLCAETGLSGNITIWNISRPERTPQCIITRHRPDSFVDQDLRAFSQDGSQIAAFDGARHLKVWDTRTGKEQGQLELPVLPELFQFTKNGTELLLVYLGREIRTWRPEETTTRVLAKLETNEHLEHDRTEQWKAQRLQIDEALQLSGDHSRLVYISRPDAARRRTAYVWNTRDGDLITHRLPADGAAGPRIALSPDGGTCAIEETWGEVQLINLDSEREITRFKCPDWTPENQLAALSRLHQEVCISNDGTFAVWCERDGSALRAHSCRLSDGVETLVVALPDPVRCVAFGSAETSLAIAAGPRIEIYDQRTGQRRCQLVRSGAGATTLAFNITGTLLVSASGNDGKLHLWDPNSGQQLAEFDTGWSGVCRVALSAKDRWLAAMDYRGRVRIWDLVQIQGTLREAGLAWTAHEND